MGRIPKPAIPSVPGGLDPTMFKLLQAIKETLEIGDGVRKDAQDISRWVTVTDLIDGNFIDSLSLLGGSTFIDKTIQEIDSALDTDEHLYFGDDQEGHIVFDGNELLFETINTGGSPYYGIRWVAGGDNSDLVFNNLGVLSIPDDATYSKNMFRCGIHNGHSARMFVLPDNSANFAAVGTTVDHGDLCLRTGNGAVSPYYGIVGLRIAWVSGAQPGKTTIYGNAEIQNTTTIKGWLANDVKDTLCLYNGHTGVGAGTAMTFTGNGYSAQINARIAGVKTASDDTGDIYFDVYDGVATAFIEALRLKGSTGAMELNALATENLDIVDAGSTGATEQDWIEVAVGGNQGYIRVFAAK